MKKFTVVLIIIFCVVFPQLVSAQVEITLEDWCQQYATWDPSTSTCLILNSWTILFYGPEVLTIPSGGTIDNNGTLIIDGPIDNYGSINNHGFIEIYSSGIVNNFYQINHHNYITNEGIINNYPDMDGFGGFYNYSGIVLNDGVINNYGSTLWNSSGGFITNEYMAIINNDEGYYVEEVGGWSIWHEGTFWNEGLVSNFGTILNKFEFNNFGSIDNYDGTITNTGSFENIPNQAINLIGTINNQGMIENYQYLTNLGTIVNGNIISNLGTIENISDGLIENNVGGTLYNLDTINSNSGSIFITNNGIVYNDGLITNSMGGSIENNSILNNGCSGVLDVLVTGNPAMDVCTIVVTSAGDNGDIYPGDGVCDDGSGDCSLRAALNEANSFLGHNIINFNILGGGPHSILPLSPLPEITTSIFIDGYTQPGAAQATGGSPAVIQIELNGTNAGLDASGLVISAPNSTIRGLAINRFGGAGILIEGDMTTNNHIAGNHIGTDTTGTSAQGNSSHGIAVHGGARANFIGGPDWEDRNVISGNGDGGVAISEYGTTQNIVQGNRIGTDASGKYPLGNTFSGVVINTGPTNNEILDNVISDNGASGVVLDGLGVSGNVVAGNLIGTDKDGTSALPNTTAGVWIVNGALNNTIGGDVYGNSNLISGNDGYGIAIVVEEPTYDQPHGNQILGNLIGTDLSGQADLGNALAGVLIMEAYDNVVGGEEFGARNIISGNDGAGIIIYGNGATNNHVIGNFIGTDISGQADLGNALTGIGVFEASGNLIGGTGPYQPNVISGNGDHGIIVSSSTQIDLLDNLIGFGANGIQLIPNIYGDILVDTSTEIEVQANVPIMDEQTIIDACGAGAILLDDGESVVVDCASLTVTVIKGPVKILFYSNEWTDAYAILDSGFSLKFDRDALSFSAPITNVAAINLVINGLVISLEPGETYENSSPTDITLDSFTVMEWQPLGTVVGNFTATDPDPDDQHLFELVPGVGDHNNVLFTIEEGVLKTNEVFIYEQSYRYFIRVRATDSGGLSYEKAFEIVVIDNSGFSCGLITRFEGFFIQDEECEALMDFYDHTGGDSWTHNEGWGTMNWPGPCGWFGVGCSNGHVYALILPYNGLVGSIPVSIGDLVGLEFLDLSDNGLYGQIPYELAELSYYYNLRVLSLSYNSFSGGLQYEHGGLSWLDELYLNDNYFLTGPLPSSLVDQSQGVFMSLFDFRNTQLCVPDDPDFQLWLDQLGEVGSTGITCPSDPYDQDGDGIFDDNAPTIFNPDQSDLDGDGVGDVADPCPSDISDTCNPDGSEASSIDATGGTVVTPNGDVEVNVPPLALSTDTTISITDQGTRFVLETNIGSAEAVFGVEIGPPGTVFDQPVTVVFSWDDADDDGVVDGTSIAEAGLFISKDGVAITGQCAIDSSCDSVANTFTFEVSSLSEFALAILLNLPPNVEAGGPYQGNEGTEMIMNASASDTEGDALTYDWSVDTALCIFYDPSVLSPYMTCIENGAYEVTFVVDDGVNDPVSDSASVTVSNVAPTLGGISVDLLLISVNTPVTASADFTDPGSLDTHTAEWDWGDGTTTGTVTQDPGFGSVSDSHSYTIPGVYTLKLTMMDSDGDFSNQSVYEFVVVYDPEGGFVTGGGWIDSPAGAYVADGGLTGKANFGFVSKYKKGANAPVGSTEFQFKAGDLNFHSSHYEWLVVNKNDANAQFKGTGTVNGNLDPNGNEYKFMLWAGDAAEPNQLDTFRIRIWWEDADGTEKLVYDNGADQEISGGSIVIHKGK